MHRGAGDVKTEAEDGVMLLQLRVLRLSGSHGKLGRGME